MAQLTRLKARSEATCDRLKSDITSIRQQKARLVGPAHLVPTSPYDDAKAGAHVAATVSTCVLACVGAADAADREVAAGVGGRPPPAGQGDPAAAAEGA